MIQNKISTVVKEKQHGVAEQGNNLFPIFLKLETLRLLIVGGGKVALEKLHAVLQNSPATKITMVAIDFTEATRNTAVHHTNVELIEKAYEISDLDETDVVIIAVDDAFTSEQIRDDAHEKGKLVNVADKPDLCDFYLGSIVKRGNLKIAISTNGKSPTIAKRLKEVFADALPEQVDDLLDNMQILRGKLNGNLSEKINKLNEITRVLATDVGDAR